MTRHIPRVAWAGPAVALALLFSSVDPPPVRAQPVPAAAAASAASPFCLVESYDFGQALAEWYDAWINYEYTVPGGTEAEILEAAKGLDAATQQVAESGIKLLTCLVKYLE